jgi:predicted TIM-barrel fold metal-dependent hydrolase
MRKFVPIFSFAIILFFTGCSNYYGIEDFEKVKKIDAHVHINAMNPHLLEQAREDNFKLLTINTDVPYYGISVKEQFEITNQLQERYPDVVSFISSFETDNFKENNWPEKNIDFLQKTVEEGAVGIKTWKNIGMELRAEDSSFVMLDDPAFDPIMNIIKQNDISLLSHVGEPKNCWLPVEEMTVNNDRFYFREHPQYHMYLHPEYPSYEELIASRDRMLERHPDMRFVGAHLGSLEWSVEELAATLDKYPNMAVDMADRICHLQYQAMNDHEKVRNFLIKYQDRLLYGTDIEVDHTTTSEEKSQWHQVWLNDWKFFVTDEMLEADEVNNSFKGMKLPKPVIRKIYYENAKRWYKGI